MERLYELRYSRRAIRGQRRMEWSYVVLTTLHVIIFVATPAEYLWANRHIKWPATVFGLILFAVALVVRLSAIRALGKFWSLHLEIREEHKLITEGIYRHVRHPAYLAIMLEVMSVPLVANAYYVLGMALLVYVPVLLMRCSREEQEMIKKFGEQYVQYRKEVPAFLPWRWG